MRLHEITGRNARKLYKASKLVIEASNLVEEAIRSDVMEREMVAELPSIEEDELKFASTFAGKLAEAGNDLAIYSAERRLPYDLETTT